MATNDLNPLTPAGADNSNITSTSGTLREGVTDTLSRTGDTVTGQMGQTGNARFYAPSNERIHLSGLFDTRADAEQAVSRLENLGIARSDVSVVYRDEESGATTTATVDEYSHGSKAGEGAGAGSMIGGTLGAILGALAATATAVAIPGIGILIAGPVAGALAGAGAGGLTGGLLGALIGAGIPEDTAKTYEAALHAGGIVVVADVPAMRAGEARAILTAQHE